MRTPVFTGTCTALITPFRADGAINYPTFARQIEAQIAGGVSALCVCGTTGEASTLSYEERAAAVAFCAEQADHRVKVIAGAGSNNTAAALRLCQQARDAGADGLLLVTPYYNKATQAGLIQHYEFIADRVDLPMILYNVPSRTGLSFTAETYRTLSAHPNINGVKEASGNFALLTHTLSLCPPDFSVWSGNDDQIVPMMALGAKGVISVAANLIPAVMVRLCRLCLDEQFHRAADLQLRYSELIDALFCEVNPIPVKTAMDLLGMEAGGLRLPLCDPTPQSLSLLRSALERAGLLT